MLTGSNVQVFDDLFDDQLRADLIETLAWVPVYFMNRKERHNSDDLDVLWYYPIAIADEGAAADVEHQLTELDEKLQVVKACWERVKATFPFPIRLYECFLSANSFGTEGRVHHDIQNVQARHRHHTVLVYCNPKWEIAWGGETLVFDDQQEITSAVSPKPGRVMKISHDPLHVGRGVSRICPSDRRVLVFKMWEREE